MNTVKKEAYEMERFTAKPKWWGRLRHKSKLKASEFLILDVIFEKTIDWGKTTDKISISQFQEELGLSNRNIIDSLDGLKKKELIFILGRERKVNTISIKMESCEKFALAEIVKACEKSSQANKASGEKSSQDDLNKSGEEFSPVEITSGESFSQSGEKSSPQLVKKVHTHDTRYHYPIPFICDFVKKQKLNRCKDFEKLITEREKLVMSLFNKWLEISGQKIKPLDKRLKSINARLKDGFTPEQIIEAMQFVATDPWHVTNGHNTIELVIRSTDQLEKKLLKVNALKNQNQNTGFNNANNQSANPAGYQPNPFSQPANNQQSSAERYAADIARQLSEYQSGKSNGGAY